ncbi:MAG: PIN domain-containing protein [Candidatus Aphodousia sp.]|nr:PIN domain-containing protein [Sutterella sp.]MDY2900274.1 PIN domain-containing protein [Candidatus Aphodousia sp.]
MIDDSLIGHCQRLIKSARTFERSFSRPICVLDTNVALDLWLFEDPSCNSLQSSIEKGEVIPVGHFDTLLELADVLSRPHFRFNDSDRQCMLERWLRFTTILDDTLSEDSFCRDHDDDKFFALAQATCATYLFSKDKKVLKARSKARRFGCQVLSPWQFNNAI